MVTTASQRVVESRSRNRGLHYSIEVFVPLTSGSESDRKQVYDTIKREMLHNVKETLRLKVKPFNGVVRCYLVD